MANQVYVRFIWTDETTVVTNRDEKVIMNYQDYFLSDLGNSSNQEKRQEAARQYIITHLGGSPSKTHNFIRVEYEGEVPINQNEPKDTTNKSKKSKHSEEQSSSNSDDDFGCLFAPFKILWKILVGLWKILMWFGRQ